MAIEDDFRVFPYSKVIRHIGSNDNVYEVSAFYSWLQDLFDEPGYMSYQKPIQYNTPTSYTMLNGWFLDNGDADSNIAGTGISDTGNILQYLTGGSIDTTGYSTIDDPVYLLDVDTEVAAFTNGDKDRVLTDDATAVGPILTFKANYPDATSGRVWVRDTRGTPATIGDGSVIAVTGGTGSYTANGASISGDEVYANIYTIASWAGSPNAQVYIKQAHPVSGTDVRVAEWSNADNWDRGSTSTEEIDILLPVKLGGTAIDSGNVVIYGRQTGDTFTHYSTSVSTTGASRTPIAMESSSDTVNITKGEHYLLYDGSDTGSFTAGDVIQDVSTASTTPPSWYAEVVSVTEFTDTGTGVLVLRGLRGSITDDDNIYVGTTLEGVANGTPGGTYFTASAVGTQLTVGLTVTGGTSGAKRVLKGVNNVASDYHYVAAVDESVTGSSKDVYYKDFTTGETITDTSTGTVTHEASTSTSIVSDYTDVTIAHVNGSVTISSVSGTFEVGELVTWNGGTSSAICLTAAVSGTTTMYLGNVDSTDEPDAADVFSGASSGASANCDSGLTDDDEMGFEFAQQSTGALYGVVIEGGTVYNAGRTLEDIYAYLQYRCRDGETSVFYTSDGSTITQVQGQFYITANASYAVSKTALFGTLAGGVFFGAQAVWIQGMATADNNSVKLTDQSGTLREPYTSIDVTVSNTRVGDRITVFLNDGNDLPDKTQFTIATGGIAQSASTISQDSSFPLDTPTAGWVYVVDNSANEEHKYRYTAWSTTDLTLATERTGTAEGTDANTLTDNEATFQTWGIEIGDIVRNVTDGGWAYVTSITSETAVETTLNSAGNPWAAAKAFEMNSTVVAYTTDDTFFIPYLEGIEDTGTDGTPGSETNTLTYTADRSVVIRVRNVGGSTPIQPFVATNTITSTGMSQSVIRTTDTVYA